MQLVSSAAFWGIPAISPHCLELETWLRMAEVPFERLTSVQYAMQAPKGKIPFILDYKGSPLDDTHFIIQTIGKDKGIDFDKSLTAEQRAVSLFIRRTTKEHLYWYTVRIRYEPEENWQAQLPMFATVKPEGMPDEAFQEAGKQYRAVMLGYLPAQGCGRHTLESHFELARADVDALAAYLGDKPYVMGDEPTSVDAAVYGAIVNNYLHEMNDPLRAVIGEHKNLVAHSMRMQNAYFPDFPFPEQRA